MARLLAVPSLLLVLSATAHAQEDVARSFSFSVGTTAARIEPATGNKSYDWIRCWQAADTPVYVGGPDVNPRDGYPICTSVPGTAPASGRTGPSCASDSIEIEADALYAVIASNPGATEAPALQSLACIAVQ